MSILIVNYLAVLVASVVAMGIGMFWYSPSGFGKQWAAQMGWSVAKMKEQMKKATGTTYLTAFAGNVVMAFVLAQLVANIGIVTVGDAVMLGIWAWVGFIATSFLSSVLWEGRTWQLYGINTAYQLVSLVVMSIILTMWA